MSRELEEKMSENCIFAVHRGKREQYKATCYDVHHN